jgi:hypothetical protein
MLPRLLQNALSVNTVSGLSVAHCPTETDGQCKGLNEINEELRMLNYELAYLWMREFIVIN